MPQLNLTWISDNKRSILKTVRPGKQVLDEGFVVNGPAKDYIPDIGFNNKESSRLHFHWIISEVTDLRGDYQWNLARQSSPSACHRCDGADNPDQWSSGILILMHNKLHKSNIDFCLERSWVMWAGTYSPNRCTDCQPLPHPRSCLTRDTRCAKQTTFFLIPSIDLLKKFTENSVVFENLFYHERNILRFYSL